MSPSGQDIFDGVRDVQSPLTDWMLRPLDPHCDTIQFSSLLNDEDFARLSDFMRAYPGVGLRAYGSDDDSIQDLEFLRFFPDVRDFSVDAIHGLKSLNGLRHLTRDLLRLTVGQTSKKLSLAPLAQFPLLRRLHLEGQTRDIEVVAGLSELRDLALRSITLSNLTLFAPLTKMKALQLNLGGTRCLQGIDALHDLRYLEVWLVRGFEELSRVAEVPTLEMLSLQALKNVTALPDLSSLVNLKLIHLHTMKGLTDLRPLLSAPALEDLALIDMAHLQPEQVAVLAEHPTLKRAILGLGSDRKNKAAASLLRLTPFEYDLPGYLASLSA